ncbi:uncharacterized protein A1O9_10953 [Exophiala aquamarina CBS 119918]|uniref:Uncharacterized protein n=1 Tax=Exophiala aquamarina CBS 119918 TaxID=1182545 RepID=A0A072PBS9_9EURO|nr:uncharacterized protein A1O9_10953 [Exophiala aquamarina CBS 119918]KEF53045.1 hypothetical protein A1O9_10953 [Exophiala aquamarina CBS 119918]
MSSDFHPSLEPFPLFIDSAPPNSANYFSSPIAMAAVQLVAAASTSSSSSLSYTDILKPRIVIPARLFNYVRLRYYQYEVTFGVYMMTPTEKVVFNSVILFILMALLYAISWGLRAFLINSLCRLIYYLVGSHSNVPQLCTPP